jgi:hypothetical protein
MPTGKLINQKSISHIRVSTFRNRLRASSPMAVVPEILRLIQLFPCYVVPHNPKFES